MEEKRTSLIKPKRKIENLNTTDTDSTSINKLPDFCLDLVFQHLSIFDRIRIERVCKRWQYVSKESWYSIRELESIFPENKCSSEIEESKVIKYYRLREILKRCGKYLLKLDLRKEGDEAYNERDVPVIISETCCKLQDLNLSCFTMEVEPFTRMISVCENLTKIIFDIGGQDSQEAIIKLLRKTRKLKYFWTRTTLIHLNCFPVDTMREIRLDGCIIITSPEINNFSNLHTLIMRKCKNLDDSSLEIMCSKMSNLKILKIAFLRVSEDGVTTKGMKHLGKLKNLEKLDVRGNYSTFTDEVLKQIADNCKKIVYLNISHNNLTDIGISEISKLKQLRYLIMQATNKVTGENLWRLTALEVLNCSRCDQLKKENLCTLLERSVTLKILSCINCFFITNNFLKVAADATAHRGNERVLEICIDHTYTSNKVAKIINRSPYLRIFKNNRRLKLDFDNEASSDSSSFKDDDWCEHSLPVEYDLTDSETDNSTDSEDELEE